MNSVVIVEWHIGDQRIYYMAALISHVLRKNSAVEYRRWRPVSSA